MIRHWGPPAAAALGLFGCTSSASLLAGRRHDAPVAAGMRTGDLCVGAEDRTSRWDKQTARATGSPGRPLTWAPAPSAELARPLASAGDDGRKNTGWRMGAVYVTGHLADSLDKYANGAGPWLFAWGYQFEIELLAEGETSALVEITPAIMGLESSTIIPTLNVLVGLRFANRFEFGTGAYLLPVPESQPDQTLTIVGGLVLTVGVGYTFEFETDEGRGTIPIGLWAGFASDATMMSVTIGWNIQER